MTSELVKYRQQKTTSGGAAGMVVAGAVLFINYIKLPLFMPYCLWPIEQSFWGSIYANSIALDLKLVQYKKKWNLS